MFKLVKSWLGTQQAPSLGPSEKRMEKLLKLEQEMLERTAFVERQRGANETAKKLLASMKANKLLPYQVQKLEEEFLVEDKDFVVEFHRILNGEDED